MRPQASHRALPISDHISIIIHIDHNVEGQCHNENGVITVFAWSGRRVKFERSAYRSLRSVNKEAGSEPYSLQLFTARSDIGLTHVNLRVSIQRDFDPELHCFLLN